MRLALLLAGIVSCAGGKERPEPGAPPEPIVHADAAIAIDAAPPPPDASMPQRTALPASFDVRVTTVLAEPVPDEVVLAVANVQAGPSPRFNHRFALTADGRLFHGRHSGKGGDWQVPFDRPLPSAPAARVPATEVARWIDRLDAAGFFDHPGYEADPRAEDGSFVIVRARRAGALHAVVYQNLRPEPIGELAQLAEVVLAGEAGRR